MNKLLLAAILVSVVGAGIVIGDSFLGTLANISYSIHTAQYNTQTSILAANINLGNLTAGEQGNYTTNASMKISSGYYVFKLNDGALRGEFSNFTVILKFSNYTIILYKDHHESKKIFLQSGEYNVNIVIYYSVAKEVHNATVSNEPLIIVKEENS
jgi:2,5-dioxopentanoate dehydrogenase